VEQTQNIIFKPVFWLIFALTLGLMPYSPEPHIWGKLKWIFSGTEGMNLLDWFDFFLHGIPWVFLIISFARKFLRA
jgi:hypothetical protein